MNNVSLVMVRQASALARGPLRIFLAAALVVIGGALAPTIPFIIDGGLYYDMARAMADNGALHIARNGGVDGAPALTKFLTHVHGGAVYPQYPSGYALLAAPFYKFLDIRGLILLNAFSAALSIWLTHAVGRRLFNERVAAWAVGLLALATFLPTYVLGVWPHMVALAFWLGAIFLALIAHEAPQRNIGSLLIFAAGFVVGAGLNIRIDLILAAPVVFLWLRFFARPTARLAPLLFFIGLTPGLLFAAYLNNLKFGVFAPISYGYAEGADSISDYGAILIVGGLFFAAAWLFNLPSLVVTFAPKLRRSAIAVTVFGFIVATALFLGGKFIANALYGVYVLVFNLQAHNAYAQVGVEPNEFGQLLFWGFPKKALIQSIPYLPLILVPLYYFCRGRNLSSIALCGLAIAAPISFYALSQWHGGGSYNMRYFIPCLPFIAILSAYTLTALIDRAGGVSRQQILMSIVAAGAAFLLMQEVGRMVPALYAPAALYPQWLLAGALAFSCTVFIINADDGNTAKKALIIALIAVSYAAAINLSEEITHEKTRAEQLAMAHEIAAAFKDKPLIISQLPVSLIFAERNGASVMVATEENISEAVQAVNAFAAAGRCVYFHNSLTRDLIRPHLSLSISQAVNWVASERFADDPRLAFFALSSQQSRCAF